MDVLTGGFPAEYGGRISAIIDMKTREGNKTRTSGLVSASPFIAKALIEGPISKFNENKGGQHPIYLQGKLRLLTKLQKRFINMHLIPQPVICLSSFMIFTGRFLLLQVTVVF